MICPLYFQVSAILQVWRKKLMVLSCKYIRNFVFYNLDGHTFFGVTFSFLVTFWYALTTQLIQYYEQKRLIKDI